MAFTRTLQCIITLVHDSLYEVDGRKGVERAVIFGVDGWESSPNKDRTPITASSAYNCRALGIWKILKKRGKPGHSALHGFRYGTVPCPCTQRPELRNARKITLLINKNEAPTPSTIAIITRNCGDVVTVCWQLSCANMHCLLHQQHVYSAC